LDLSVGDLAHWLAGDGGGWLNSGADLAGGILDLSVGDLGDGQASGVLNLSIGDLGDWSGADLDKVGTGEAGLVGGVDDKGAGANLGGGGVLVEVAFGKC
jgi:hypothetical protein